jgi:hypothetical protein
VSRDLPGVPGPRPLLDRIYERWITAADRAHEHRRLVWLLGAPLVVLALSAINRLVLIGFPNSGDEYVYLYQAQTMAAGRLWNTPIEPADVFAFNYIVQEPGRVFGSFPVGWPLAIAAALWLHVPSWLVNPVLGALSLALVWQLGSRLYGPRIGVSAAALVAVSPFFLFNAASYFSHTFCGALLVGSACLAAREDRTAAWVPVGAGFLVGWAVLARYFTGVVCAIPVVLWLLRPGVSRLRTAALFALGGLPWAALLAWYNTMLSGSPWHLTTRPLTVSLWFSGNFMLRGADMLATHIVRHLMWTPPAMLVAYLVYLRLALRETRRGLFDWMLVLVAGGLYFYIERGGNQYGPRFHYEAFLFMAVFVAANLFRGDRLEDRPRSERVLFALVAASVAVTPVLFAAHAFVEREVIRERMDPFATAATVPARALVLIQGRVGTRRSMAGYDLTRNGIDYDGRILYGLDVNAPLTCEAARRFPDRQAYVYRWDGSAPGGNLARLDCSWYSSTGPGELRQTR